MIEKQVDVPAGGPSTEHGFAFPRGRCYDKAAAEKHGERLFSRRLR